MYCPTQAQLRGGATLSVILVKTRIQVTDSVGHTVEKACPIQRYGTVSRWMVGLDSRVRGNDVRDKMFFRFSTLQ